MSGLELIGEYSSESEDEDQDVEHDDDKRTVNNISLPKYTPTGVGVAVHGEVLDNPAEHSGRVRSFNHERGNWATLVYVDYIPSDAILSWMISVSSKMPSGTLIDDCHVSLTRTLILKYHWIESFVESIKELAQGTSKFVLQMTDIKIYCNEERTRTFLGIECPCLDETLTLFMKSLNKILGDYQLPPFYEDASYHISFLWFLGDKEDEVRELISTLNESFIDTLSNNFENSYINVQDIHCKIGNKLYRFNLR